MFVSHIFHIPTQRMSSQPLIQFCLTLTITDKSWPWVADVSDNKIQVLFSLSLVSPLLSAPPLLFALSVPRAATPDTWGLDSLEWNYLPCVSKPLSSQPWSEGAWVLPSVGSHPVSPGSSCQVLQGRGHVMSQLSIKSQSAKRNSLFSSSVMSWSQAACTSHTHICPNV